MTFHEKLRKRVAELGLNKARTAREVGLPESTISSYLSKDESLPRIDIALKIARGIKVPLGWLANDELPWPPPPQPTDSAIQNVPDGFLMREVCRRLRLAMLDVKEQIEKAERIDWREIADKLLKQPVESPFPPDLASEIELAQSLLFASSGLYKFEASDAIKAHWRDLPPVDISEEDLDFGKLLSRLHELNQRPGCGAAQFYLFLLSTEHEHPDPAKVIDARNKLKTELEKIEGSVATAGTAGKSKPKPPPKK